MRFICSADAGSNSLSTLEEVHGLTAAAEVRTSAPVFLSPLRSRSISHYSTPEVRVYLSFLTLVMLISAIALHCSYLPKHFLRLLSLRYVDIHTAENKEQ